MTEPSPVTELELERHCYLLARQRRAICDSVPRPPGVERLGQPAASLGDPIPGAVRWFTSGTTRHVVWRAEWRDVTLRLDRLDRRLRRWVFDPEFLDRIGGARPDDSLREIDEAEARRIADALLPS